MGFGVIGFRGDDLFKGGGGLVKEAVLKEGDAVSEIVALEAAVVEFAGKGKRFGDACFVSARNVLSVDKEFGRI